LLNSPASAAGRCSSTTFWGSSSIACSASATRSASPSASRRPTRCPKHNAEVGGKPNSWHAQAAAADIQVDGMTPAQLAPYAMQAGFKEIVPEGDPKAGWLHAAVRD
jgi:hypothetical protein